MVLVLVLSACNSSKLISEQELERKNYQEVIGAIDENKPQPDTYAMYQNGLKGILDHIVKTVIYPGSAIKSNTQGEVWVEFIVETNGQVKEAKVIGSVSPELDKEALRVILQLERFHPGFKDSKPVRVMYRQPINFKLI